jgi:hypothetical protein
VTAHRITAKVRLGSKQSFNEAGDTILNFYPDYADGRNKEWASASPSLSLMMTVRKDVAELFEQMGTYTLVFEKNDDDKPKEVQQEVSDGGNSSA